MRLVSSPYRYSNNITDTNNRDTGSVVSSPYRYSNNEMVSQSLGVENEVSSPYRYSNNARLISSNISSKMSFKSL